MNILVTGGAGYIGSHIVKLLLEKKYNVFVFDNLSKGHRHLVLGGKFIEGDLKKREQISDAIKENQIEAVCHLAADSLVSESMENPGKYYYNNLINGINLLEEMVLNNVKSIVFSSTAAVYGEPNEIPITESHPLLPKNPYGESKLFFEKILDNYRQRYGINYISLRYFNAAGADFSAKIGELHNPETHLIPIILTKILKKETIPIFGNDYDTSDGTCVRDYIHVNDLSDAHILAIEYLKKEKQSQIYNLGSEKGYSVKEVIKTAEDLLKIKIQAEVKPKRKGDPAVLVASSKNIKKELGWKPKNKDLEVMIETAWNWHKKQENLL